MIGLQVLLGVAGYAIVIVVGALVYTAFVTGVDALIDDWRGKK
jgi:hypothetical protein